MLRVLLTLGGMQVAAMAALLARTKGLAIILGPGNVGVMAVIDKLVAMIAQTASLSLPFAALRFLPGATETQGELVGTRRAMAATVVMASLAVTAVTVTAAVLRPELFGAELATRRSWLVLGLLTVPVVAAASFLPSAFAGSLDRRSTISFTVAHASALAVTGLAGAWLGGVRGVYLAYILLGGVYVMARLRTLVGPAQSGTLRQPGLPREVWRFSLSMLPLAWLVPYAALFTHYQVLEHFGAEVSGYMQAAVGISLALRTVLGTGHQFFLTPNVNRKGDPADRFAWASRYQRTLALLVGVLAPPVLLTVDLVVRVLFSSAFLAAVPFVWMFVCLEVMTLFIGAYQSLVLAFDHLRFHVLQTIAAQAVTLGLAAALIPGYGVLGAVIAPAGGQVVLWVGTVFFLRLRFGLHVPAPTLLLTGATATAVVAAGLSGAGLPWSLHGGAVRLVVWLTGLLVLFGCMNADERARLRTIVARVAGAAISARDGLRNR